MDSHLYKHEETMILSDLLAERVMTGNISKIHGKSGEQIDSVDQPAGPD